MKNKTTVIITALLFLVVGFGIGLWYGTPPSDVTITKTSADCFEISVDPKSKKAYKVVKDGQASELEPGETREVCGQFEFYESIPIPWDD